MLKKKFDTFLKLRWITYLVYVAINVLSFFYPYISKLSILILRGVILVRIDILLIPLCSYIYIYIYIYILISFNSTVYSRRNFILNEKKKIRETKFKLIRIKTKNISFKYSD